MCSSINSASSQVQEAFHPQNFKSALPEPFLILVKDSLPSPQRRHLFENKITMPWKAALTELSQVVRNNVDKLLKVLPDNITTRSNAVKTVDLRVDVHQSSQDPNKAVAKVQANAQAKDNAVKDYIKSGNKGGGHKGTHKNIVEIPFDRTSFDVDDFTSKLENAPK